MFFNIVVILVTYQMKMNFKFGLQNKYASFKWHNKQHMYSLHISQLQVCHHIRIPIDKGNHDFILQFMFTKSKRFMFTSARSLNTLQKARTF